MNNKYFDNIFNILLDMLKMNYKEFQSSLGDIVGIILQMCMNNN